MVNDGLSEGHMILAAGETITDTHPLLSLTPERLHAEVQEGPIWRSNMRCKGVQFVIRGCTNSWCRKET